MDVANLRWWGWGTLNQSYSLEGRPTFWPTLQEWLKLPDEAIERETAPIPLEEVSLRPPRLDDPMLFSLRRLLGEKAVRTDKRTRVEHAYGKSYRDLIRIRAGYIPNPPDVVIYPADQGQVVSVLAWAADRDVAVIPFGGGSSVLGGVEPAPDAPPTITIDLACLDRVLSVDPVSRTARIQSGVTGPELEDQLNARGFTMGHFPQSFEFSTLGGWVATRSTGQNSIGYGKIEHMTQAVRFVTPAGIIETRDVPTTVGGPGLMDVLIGSEGTYGIMTEATMRLHPLPEVKDYRSILFHTLEDGIAAFRDLMQSQEVQPAIVRLSDGPETSFYSALSHERHGFRRWGSKITERYLGFQGFDLTPGSCNTLMLLGFEGNGHWVNRQWRLAMKICGDQGGLSLGRGLGQSWMRDRYAQPYLRDVLLGHGVMVETLETATTWSNLMNVYEAMVYAIKGAIAATDGGSGYVMTHISHACEQGASLCSTFLGRQVEDSNLKLKLAQLQVIKQAAIEAILAAGGTLSHHYGIGHDHVPWLEEEVGILGIRALRALKRAFDPTDILSDTLLR